MKDDDIPVTMQVEALHHRIGKAISILMQDHPDDVALKQTYYDMAKYEAGIIPSVWVCRDLPKLQIAAAYLEGLVRAQTSKVRRAASEASDDLSHRP